VISASTIQYMVWEFCGVENKGKELTSNSTIFW